MITDPIVEWLDFKTVFIASFSIGTIEWVKAFAIVYPVLTGIIQIIIGFLTITYLIVRIKNAKK